MKKNSAVITAAALTILAGAMIGPEAIAAYPGTDYGGNSSVRDLGSKVKSGGLSLADFVTEVANLTKVKPEGFVLCNGGKDLILTDHKYEKGKQLTEYTAIILFRAEHGGLFNAFGEAFGKAKDVDGRGEYFAL